MASTRQRPQMCMVVMYMNEIIMFRFLYFNVRYRLTIFRVVILTWADKLSESNSLWTPLNPSSDLDLNLNLNLTL